MNSNFDPSDLLQRFYPLYKWDYNGDTHNMHVDISSLSFLAKVLNKKRKQILADHPNPDQEYIDRSYMQGKQEVKASAWLEYIDYALIKCYLDLKKYKELAEFFSNADRVFCNNIKERVRRFIETVEKESQVDVTLKKMILAFLYEIIEDYAKALDYWRDYVFSKASEQDQTPFKVAIRILINSQSNKPLFFDLLVRHVEWLSHGMSTLQQLFGNIRIDTIMPDTIHDRLRSVKESKDYHSIMENFYNTMIRVHKIRSETYHTELAKIYLKKALSGSASDYEEFRAFIRDPTSM